MNESISICIASYNTLSTRKEGLDRCLEGLRKSIEYFNKLHPDIKVVVSWVDDASTDDTYEYVRQVLNSLNINNLVIKLKTNSHQGYCRNLATKFVDSDYIMFCDSDDDYEENHIKVCYDLINVKDSANRSVGIASTLAKLDPELNIHPDWIPRISSTIPITKIVRRDIWEFMEGFPVNEVYKTTGCEDQDFVQMASLFFTMICASEPTVNYRNYPGSFFDRQIPKFQKHPSEMTPSETDEKNKYLHSIRSKFMFDRLDYLKRKLMWSDWSRKLEKYTTNYVG